MHFQRRQQSFCRDAKRNFGTTLSIRYGSSDGGHGYGRHPAVRCEEFSTSWRGAQSTNIEVYRTMLTFRPMEREAGARMRYSPQLSIRA